MLPRLTRIRTVLGGWPVLCLAGCALTAVLFWHQSHKAPTRTLRIAVDHAPPYQFVNANGTPVGITVDLFNEAARRNGISLQWVPVDGSPDEGFRRGMVDLWPAAAVSAERRAWLYISEPWLKNTYTLVSRRRYPGAPPPDRRVVAHTNSRILGDIAKKSFPGTQLMVKPNRTEVIRAVCSGEAEGFVETRFLEAALLKRPSGCGDIEFQLTPVPSASHDLAILSTHAYASTADVLRAELARLSTDGTLAETFDLWSPLSAAESKSVSMLQASERQTRLMMYGLAVALVSILILAALSRSLFRANRSIRNAQARNIALTSQLRDERDRWHLALQGNHDGLFDWNAVTGEVFYSERWKQMLGYSDEEFPNSATAWEERIHPDDISRVQEAIRNHLQRRTPFYTMEYRLRHKDSSWRWILARAQAIWDEDGTPVRMVGSHTDITERKRSEEALRASDERFHAFMDNGPFVAFTKDAAGRILYVNRSFASAFHVDRDTVYGKSNFDIWPAAVAERLGEHGAQVISQGHPIELVHTLPTPDGQSREWLVVKFPFRDGGELLVGGMAVDITERRQAEQALRASEERWQLALRGNDDGLWDWDARTGEVFYSLRWKQMLGYEEHEIQNNCEEWKCRVHPDDAERVHQEAAEHLTRKTEHYISEYRLRAKDGSYRWVLARGKAVWDENGNPLRMVGSHCDITERKNAELALAYAAQYDALTGLPNRRFWLERLEAALKDQASSGVVHAVCVCDIDRFKQINDTHGHAAGDEVLRTFGQLLLEEMRGDDMGGRLAGDEFCILFPHTTAGEAAAVVESIREQLQTQVFGAAGGSTFSVTATFGIAEAKPGGRAQDVLEVADQALYAAKRAGRNQSASSTAPAHRRRIRKSSGHPKGGVGQDSSNHPTKALLGKRNGVNNIFPGPSPVNA